VVSVADEGPRDRGCGVLSGRDDLINTRLDRTLWASMLRPKPSAPSSFTGCVSALRLHAEGSLG